MFSLGQRVRVVAEAMTAYDQTWYRLPDDLSRTTKESFPANWAVLGWQCAHTPEVPNGQPVKRLWRRPFDAPRLGVIIGRSRRATGHWKEGSYDYDAQCHNPNRLVCDRTFPVYEVALSLRCDDRVFALAEDIEEA